MNNSRAYLGIDIGSITVKVVLLNEEGGIVFSRYQRHFSEVRRVVVNLIREAYRCAPDHDWALAVCGSGAISLAKELSIDFVQEVIACTNSVQHFIPDTDVTIELGGEDAKICFLTGGVEQRMNETCAGGTGAFIDQMAAFLETDAAGLNELAKTHKIIYPIASRCGVFAKTDILPLLNEGCARQDIAASIFQAVVDQTVSGLACGREIKGKVAFLGGPLAFLSSLRERFMCSLGLDETTAIFPVHAEFFVALGTALYEMQQIQSQDNPNLLSSAQLLNLLDQIENNPGQMETQYLPPLFENAEDRKAFMDRHAKDNLPEVSLEDFKGDTFLGFDSGSTTIKAVLIDRQGRLLFSSYGPHKGAPLDAAVAILGEIYSRMNSQTRIVAGAATGYGSALLRAALKLDIDEVETIAHCKGAQFFMPGVSFILDIGGQDIKCLRVNRGVIDRIQLNEACSAGCGSFIETFAKSLGIPLPEFVESALNAKNPIDLGTRCTVFMNSKVKQAQKEGATVGDIAAGLSYSVIKNAIYKVIKISSPEEMGNCVIAQGGSFYNDALLRALEIHLGINVIRPGIAGLMGAFGAALLARDRGPSAEASEILGAEDLRSFSVRTSNTRCKGCTNHCLMTITRFTDGSRFVSGNRCEKGAGGRKEALALPNLYDYKYKRLFDYYTPLPKELAHRGTVGIPRVLNMFENYPLWFTFLTNLGYRVELSSPSSKEIFDLGFSSMPSQTVCYPAKLAHGHIMDLIRRKVDFIFFPCLPFELKEFSSQNNHYNCPIVGGYPELLAQNIGALNEHNIPIIYPFLPLDEDIIAKRLHDISLFSDISFFELQMAIRQAFVEWKSFKADIRGAGEKALAALRKLNKPALILAGHPYHVDPEIHHGIPDVVISCGMGVLTEDSVAHLRPDPGMLRVVDQWTYHSRLYRAGVFVSEEDNMAVLQLVSFGCGLDAVTTDQVEEILAVKNKLYAQIKIDEGANLGAARIRIRSLAATLKEQQSNDNPPAEVAVYKGSPPFTKEMLSTHTILIPQMSPIHFQFIETVFSSCGYKTAQLQEVSRDALEMGLRHVHNDACLPAITVVGQLLHAVRCGQFDPRKVALMITQTGGGCRATNYIAFLRKALVDCNLDYIPVISFNLEGYDQNPGFKLSSQLGQRFIMAGYFGDVLMRVLYRTRPYELEPGSAMALVDRWAERCKKSIAKGSIPGFHKDMAALVQDFDNLPLRDEPRKPRVGLVGEILLKYHPDANNQATDLLEKEGGEAVVPDLTDFILYSLYDDIYRYRHLSGSYYNFLKSVAAIAFLEYARWSMRKALSKSKRFHPPLRFSELRKKAASIISLGHQTGEGWLLTAEMVELLESGVPNILCMQPFGCLPNHITGKGVIKQLKRRHPNANIVAVDYDSSASEVNQVNRIKLMMSLARLEAQNERDQAEHA